MISARAVLAAKTAGLLGAGGAISRGLSHVGDSLKPLDTPHMGKAIDAFGHAANLAAGVGAVAAPVLSSILPSADARINQQMNQKSRAAGPAMPAGMPSV